MKTYILLFLSCLFPMFIIGQSLKGKELLNKTIQYHDPQGEWATAQLDLSIRAERGDGSVDTQRIALNLPNSFFHFEGKRVGKDVELQVKGEECTAKLEGESEIPEDLAKKYRLTCESAKRYRDYFLYLYGLPMKLRDPGTIIEDEVLTAKFNGKLYHVLEVRYEPEVGSHTWLFYINPKTFAMEGYQFYRDENTKKGEYITLEGLSDYGNMRLPKTRRWYTYPEKEYLGADILLK